MVMGASRATRRPPRKWRVSPRTATTTSVAREHNALPITLEAANVCPYQGTSVIARDPLPAHAATFGDQLKMPIAPRWRGLGLCTRHRRRSRRHNDRGIRMALGDFAVDIVPIVCAVTSERGDRTCYLFEERSDL